jgi:hypothetical protein
MLESGWKIAKKMKWILVVLCLLSPSSFAQEWYKITISEQGDVYYIDLKSVIRIGDIVSYWSKGNYGEPTKYGDLSSLGSYRVNCTTKESIIGLIYFYSETDNGGERTSVVLPKNQSWRPVTPETINASLMRFVCKR